MSDSFDQSIKAARRVREVSRKRKLEVAGLFGLAFLVFYAAFVIYALISVTDERSFKYEYIAEAVMLAVFFSAFIVYTLRSCSQLTANLKELAAAVSCAALGFIACLFLKKLSYFCMPVALTAVLMATIARKRDAFFYNLCVNVMVMLTFMILSGSGDYASIVTMFVVGMLCGTLAAYLLRRDTRRSVYILLGLIIVVIGMVLFFILSLAIEGNFDVFVNEYYYILSATAGSVVVALILEPLIEGAFNLVTDKRLVELTDRNAPLMKILVQKAPGTYNHCLAVANFAEICALAVGENPYLARTAAMYHDVGKTASPEYFTENQAGVNPHDDLLPEVSADIIRKHTVGGYELCKKHRIPEELARVTVEHHGTLPILVFYNKAKSLTDGDVDISDYSYHGTTPTTKIAAIIMICDAGEAAIRAMEHPDGERVNALMESLISDRINRGQFDNCPVTMNDLNIIKNAIVGAYGGLFHNRLKYPTGTKN